MTSETVCCNFCGRNKDDPTTGEAMVFCTDAAICAVCVVESMRLIQQRRMPDFVLGQGRYNEILREINND